MAILHIHHMEKWINMYGFMFGDRIIKDIGSKLEAHLPSYNTKVYRIDGNRFAILTTDEHMDEQIKKSLEKVLAAYNKLVYIDSYHIQVEMVCTVSFTKTKKSVADLFSDCMAVLQHPSIRYQHELVEYNPTIHTFSIERLIVQDITKAMENEELFLVYQPKVHSRNLQITGVEALLRWKHPTEGFISPATFIPILEENGKIHEVTDWVIDKVCAQIAEWKQRRVSVPQVSINTPGTYVTSARLLQVLQHSMQRYHIDGQFIELEITETSVIHDMENAINAVKQFRMLGLSVALDDFGTGLSSLSYLRRIPINTIKIDKSFVKEVPLSEKVSALLSAIITLCHSLKLTIIIEGVETEEQISFISSIEKELQIQGYYYSKPLQAGELEEWLKKQLSEFTI